MMKIQSINPLMLIKLLTLHSLLVLSASQDFDFFYFVQQWPGSYCDTTKGCCYPSTGKPVADFGIHGLWPNRNDGSYPSNCDSNNPFDASKISDLTSKMQSDWPTLSCPSSSGLTFWGHEWDKHGTCSESVLNQHDYFATSLSLKNEIDLLQALEGAGIQPNGQTYSLSSIKSAIKGTTGYTPYIECNNDESVSYNAIITGYVRNSRPNEALSTFLGMQGRTAVKPTDVTMRSVLSACALLGALDTEKWVHEYVKGNGFDQYVNVNTTLIDMYSKCGSLDDVVLVFENMGFRDTQAWSAMIMAYTVHGHGHEAISLFENMRREQVEPDRITLLGLLYACNHAGFVHESLTHGNLELGRRVLTRIFELDQSHGGDYVIFANMCTRARKQKDAEYTRKLMKDRGVVKVPGCSMIEVENQVHEFFLGDGSRVGNRELHLAVDKLFEKLKSAGYKPDVSLVVHSGMNDDEKEISLWYHSEKLAITFGLLNTPHGETIRVAKNVRICGDCHSACKLLPLVCDREIFVRDVHRFHHFAEGKC
ncbi:hypothetical protein OSB04_018349 [Centaurea solstitialis]|uniref:DYW domain-containing protein n=1 Tax=Centaurea solstitialis TaxID=347529 RepID=A0AA38T6C7_9ASTR|nr:hypothetical protein OSB04_018349 [Centaurea solstitialis]